MKDAISKKIEEKLLPTIKNFQDGNASEHDIFPSLLWLLLENSKELEQKNEITKNDLLRQIEKLKPIFQENISTIVTQENKKTLSLLKWLIGFCIFQLIGLGALAAIILTR